MNGTQIFQQQIWRNSFEASYSTSSIWVALIERVIRFKEYDLSISQQTQLDFAREAFHTPDLPLRLQIQKWWGWGKTLEFKASYLKNDTWTSIVRKIGPKLGVERKGVQGIIRDLGACSIYSNELCFDYVSRKLGVFIDLSPETLLNQGYEVVSVPQKDDVIFYFNSKKEKFSHVGLVSKIENEKAWIESKWGNFNCFEHLKETVPEV